ncbi:MAG: hypothetical protein ACI8R4_000137 [Paracoccaceae bacterium]|jgi:hypothetical protein
MEIVEDRYQAGSTLITSQLPIDAWHDVMGEPAMPPLSDALIACRQWMPQGMSVSHSSRRNRHIPVISPDPRFSKPNIISISQAVGCVNSRTISPNPSAITEFDIGASLRIHILPERQPPSKVEVNGP